MFHSILLYPVKARLIKHPKLLSLDIVFCRNKQIKRPLQDTGKRDFPNRVNWKEHDWFSKAVENTVFEEVEIPFLSTTVCNDVKGRVLGTTSDGERGGKFRGGGFYDVDTDELFECADHTTFV